MNKYQKLTRLLVSTGLLLTAFTVGPSWASGFLLSRGTTLHFIGDPKELLPINRDQLQLMKIAIVPAGIRMIRTGKVIVIDGIKRFPVATERGVKGLLKVNQSGAKPHYMDEDELIRNFRKFGDILIMNQTRRNLSVVGKNDKVKLSSAEVYRFVKTSRNFFLAKPVDQEAADAKNIALEDQILVPIEAAHVLMKKNHTKLQKIRTGWFTSDERLVLERPKNVSFKSNRKHSIGEIQKRCGDTLVIVKVNGKSYEWKAGGGVSLGGSAGPSSLNVSLSGEHLKQAEIKADQVSNLPAELNVAREIYADRAGLKPYEITRNQKCVKDGSLWKSLDEQFYSLIDSSGLQIELEGTKFDAIKSELANPVSLIKKNGRIRINCMQDYRELMRSLTSRSISTVGSNLLLIHSIMLPNDLSLSKCNPN